MTSHFGSPWRASIACASAALLILHMAGCRRSDAPSQAYFPLSLGNRWIYTKIDGDSLTIEVIGRKAYDGFQLIEVLETYLSWSPDKKSRYVANRHLQFRSENDGSVSRKVLEHGSAKLDLHWLDQQPNSLGGGWFPWYRFTAGEGDCWTSRATPWVSAEMNESARYRITMISRFDSVTTPAGTFSNCRNFHFQEMENNRVGEEIDEWYAPGVGMVARNQIREPTGVRAELSYRLVYFQKATQKHD